MHTQTKLAALVVLGLAAPLHPTRAALLTTANVEGAGMTFPARDWEEVKPASQRVDAGKLRVAVEYLKANAPRDGVNELVVIRNGRLIHKGSDVDKVHGIWSCTKSFTSTVLGLLVDDGKCTPDTLAKDHVPEMAASYPQVTLRHFATMTSGYRAVGDEPRGGYTHGPSRTPFQPGPQPLFAPGSKYAYWDSAMNQFGHVLTRIAGEPIEELFKRRVADPIGMNPDQWDWGDFGSVQGVVVNGGSGNNGKHMRISAREMARFGHLLLNGGDWRGRQLLSREWIKQATQVHVPATLPLGHVESGITGPGMYGFNWWVNGVRPDGSRKWPGVPAETYAASGHNNNDMFVIPAWNMVIVRLGLDEGGEGGFPISDQTHATFLRKVGDSIMPASGAQTTWPAPEWPVALPGDVGLDAHKLAEAQTYALSAGGSGLIVRHGNVAIRWGDQQQRYDIKSATKSFGATMLGVALIDGKIVLDAPASRYHPTLGVPPRSNVQTGWLKSVTILHLATQTAGFDKRGGYEKLLFQPGTRWHYSDGGPNWLAECITLAYRRDLEELMFERVFTPLGITRDDLRWRNNQYRQHDIEGIPRREFGAGIHANVEALSRLGYLYLQQGRWQDAQILTKEFVTMASRPVPSVAGLPEWAPQTHGNASDHYGLLWWNNVDGALKKVPRDAYWAWGLFDSLVIIVPSLDLVIARGGESGKQWPRKEGEHHYHVLEPFLTPIVAAVVAPTAGDDSNSSSSTIPNIPNAPYPPSTVIKGIQWAPRKTIIRLAEGSDNWPLTWADDGHLYSAYGDGWGFEPKVERKLSLGLVRVQGAPPDVQGFNIRSPDAERIGQGPDGLKASGMLMVDGVLYMLVRNADNAQLAWSRDHGKTWTWADWKWTSSFGCPTFLNFGQNYAGARDGFVYVYSHDSDSAYEPADRMVLARVPKGRIRIRAAYEFFKGLDAERQPTWTRQLRQRGEVFRHSAGCYRSGISYNAGLDRYLWCQVMRQSSNARGPRFQGGFGIYEASEPWGPWRTVYFTRDWDVGPGETSSIPSKWISEDGKTIHLVFSGDDCFSVRKATLTTDEL